MKNKVVRRYAFLVAFLILTVSSSFSQGRERLQDRQKVKGTSVRMSPPKNFKQSDDFTGFMHEASGVSIVLFETLDIANSVYVKNLDDEYFESQGLVLEREEVIESGGRKEYLFECTTEVEGTPLYRLFFITGDKDHTVVSVTHIVPEVYDEMYPEVYEALLSIKDKQ